eukprot:TRINITY_DN6324_c0_g1_i2.p1 TRINITY_DN6324_c0_g1~~TRINITY_DN6324_c0_g1_i2.p1  ORF type:complete len:646 (+),score=110.02 TRINITY_DN6324_c0_g1_i2:65-2002(+)
MGGKQTTLLHSGIEANCNHCFEKGLNQGIDINSQDAKGETPLHVAATMGNQAVMQELLNQDTIQVNVADKKGLTPVHSLSKYGHDELIELLVDKNAEINSQDNMGNTPLHIAVQQQEEKVVQKLLQLGADVNIQNKEGDNPIHLASRRSKRSMLKILLEDQNEVQEADLSSLNEKGYNPVHIAVIRNEPDILKYLLNKGGNPLGVTSKNETPLQLAMSRGKKQSASVLRAALERTSISRQRKFEKAEEEKNKISKAAVLQAVMMAGVLSKKQVDSAQKQAKEADQKSKLLREQSFKQKTLVLKQKEQIDKQEKDAGMLNSKMNDLQENLKVAEVKNKEAEEERWVAKVTNTTLAGRIQVLEEQNKELQVQKNKQSKDQNEVKQIDTNEVQTQTEEVVDESVVTAQPDQTVDSFSTVEQRNLDEEVKSSTMGRFKFGSHMNTDQNDLAVSQTEGRSYSKKVGKSEQDGGTRSEEAADMEVMLLQANAEISTAVKKNEQLEEKVVEQESKIRQLERALEVAQQDIGFIEEERQELELNLKMHTAQLDTKKKQAQQMRESIDAYEWHNKRLEQEKSFLNATVEALQGEIRQPQEAGCLRQYHPRVNIGLLVGQQSERRSRTFIDDKKLKKFVGKSYQIGLETSSVRRM